MPTSPNKVKKTVEIWGDDFEWLEREFNRPSLSYIVGCLVHALREICENPREHPLEKTTLMEQSKAAAELFKEEI